MGVNLDPAILGQHIQSGAGMTVEVITRWLDDRGGGLARIDGRLRLIEGLALPHEELEFDLSYYNSASYWIDIDQILKVFGLDPDRSGQSDQGDGSRPGACSAHADLHHAEERQEALGKRAGRRLPHPDSSKSSGET